MFEHITFCNNLKCSLFFIHHPGIEHFGDPDFIASNAAFYLVYKCNKNIYFILSSEINVYQKWIKVIFSLQN